MRWDAVSIDFQRLEQLLAEAAGKTDPAQRTAFLDKACGDDRELRAEVERLLAAHEQAGSFLESPLMPDPKAMFGDRPDETEALPGPDRVIERVGTTIGRYKLLEEIGEGGFGVVYMAEQIEPVQRKVALKIIKAGMDTREVVARFKAERQALALMDHPSIAQVFDGGITQSGRPYFVMELVRGIPITDFCDQRNVAMPERLKLFMQVCHAVQHAHQKGVIHRDLKPSNILVTLIDGQPLPKVIDFGVAKALGQKLTDQTLFTGFLRMVGTPAYMSPEQADLSGVDVDTRADIYALGVLLYELLTGVTPFDAETFRRAALDEIRRVIRETEPPKPSTRLHTLGDRLPDVARHRHTEPAALSRLVRGDLDWIVMKCLEKDRRRRYETPNSLAEDIERHLKNEPVLAGPPGTAYRMRKFVRRNRIPVVFSVSVAAALVVGLVFALVGFAQARRDRDRALRAERQAETEAARSGQVAQFMKDMLKGVGPQAALGRDTTVLREILDATVERVGKDLADRPAVQAELRTTIGDVYLQLGDFTKAEAMMREALRLRSSRIGDMNQAIAASRYELARVLARRGGEKDLAEADEALRQALAVQRELLGNEHADIANSLALLAGTLQRQRKLAEAEAASWEALEIRRKLLGRDHPEVASSLDNLALVLREQGKLGEAEAVIREALAIQRRAMGDEGADVATSLSYLGSVLRRAGRLVEAESAYREALSLRTELYGYLSVYTEAILSALISVLEDQGRFADAEALRRQRRWPEPASASSSAWLELARACLDLEERASAKEDVDKIRKLFTEAAKRGGAPDPAALELQEWSGRGDSYLRGRKWANAVRAYSRAIELKPHETWFYHDRGYCHMWLNKFQEMLADYTRAVELSPQDSDNWARRGLAHLRLGRSEEAVADYTRAVDCWLAAGESGRPTLMGLGDLFGANRNQAGVGELCQKLERIYREDVVATKQRLGPDHRETERALSDLAQVLKGQGKLAEAEVVCREELEVEKRLSGDKHPRVANSLMVLGPVLRDQRKLVEAEGAFREALAIRRQAFGNDDAGVAQSLSWLASAVFYQGKLTEAEVLLREAVAIRRKNRREIALASELNFLALVLQGERQLAEAEALAREAVDILRKLPDESGLANALSRLGSIRFAQKEFIEAETLIRECIVILRKESDESELAAALQLLTNLLSDQKAFAKAEPPARELLAIRRKQVDETALAGALAILTLELLEQNKFAEAEPLAREALAIREKKLPDAWPTFNARSMLGGSLLGQKKYEEAEPLLVSGYEGVKQRESQIPAPWRTTRLKEALERLIQLYEQTGQPDKAAEWRSRLTDTEEAAARLNQRLPNEPVASPTTWPATQPTAPLIALIRESPQGVARGVELALNMEPPDIPADLLPYGECLLLAGQSDRAVRAIQLAIAFGGQKHYYHKSLGWALARSGRMEEARAAFKVVIGSLDAWPPAAEAVADPDHWTAAYFLDLVTQDQYAERWRKDARFAEKFACFPWFYIAQRMEMEDKPEEAITAYRKSVELGELPLAHPLKHWSAYRLHVLTGEPLSTPAGAADSMPTTQTSTRPAY